MNAIEIKNIKKKLDEFELSIGNVEIKKGFITGFIGPNGSGKTTTIKLIMNMLLKDSGTIKIFDKEYEMDDIQTKELVGYVGDIQGYVNESKLKNIKKGIAPFYKNWDDDLYKKYINKFGINENKRYKDLSKGQQKKFDLVMALSHHPKIIIMDEPTANLDPIVRNEFLDILQEHIEKEEATVFYSTHITSDLDKVADYLVFIYNGKVILQGEKDTLIENHKIVRGKKDLLDYDTKKTLVSYSENSFGFDGLTSNVSNAYEIFGEEVVYDKVNLEDLLVYYTRG